VRRSVFPGRHPIRGRFASKDPGCPHPETRFAADSRRSLTESRNSVSAKRTRSPTPWTPPQIPAHRLRIPEIGFRASGLRAPCPALSDKVPELCLSGADALTESGDAVLDARQSASNPGTSRSSAGTRLQIPGVRLRVSGLADPFPGLRVRSARSRTEYRDSAFQSAEVEPCPGTAKRCPGDLQQITRTRRPLFGSWRLETRLRALCTSTGRRRGDKPSPGRGDTHVGRGVGPGRGGGSRGSRPTADWRFGAQGR